VSTEPGRSSFHAGTVLGLTLAHIVNDTYPAFLGILLPLLIARFDLSLGFAGLLASVLTLSSLGQPLFGYIVDKSDARLWVVVTPATSAICMGLLAIAPSPFVAFVLLLGGGLSLAAFHPAASALVTQVTRGEWGTATSWFMTGGPIGAALGPLVIAALISAVGIQMSWVALVPGVLFSVVLHLGLRRVAGRIVRQPPGAIRPALRRQLRSIVLLSVAVGVQAMAAVGFSTFYPTYATSIGMDLAVAGISMAVYQAGGVVGVLGGGWLSDRFGRRASLLVSPLVGVPVMFVVVLSGSALFAFPLLFAGGAFLMGASPVQLVLMQELLPENRSLAAGLMFFLSIGAASVATIVVGFLGDLLGLQRALLIAIVGSLLSVPFVFLLPRRVRQERAPA